MKLGSVSLIPPATGLVTLAHPLAIHVLHSITGVGGPATTTFDTAAAMRFLLLPLLAAIGTGFAILLAVLPSCLPVPCNLCFIMWLLAVRQEMITIAFSACIGLTLWKIPLLTCVERVELIVFHQKDVTHMS